jgi:L-aspartate oxidase
MPKSDVVIIGSGLAALVTASRLCMTKNVIIFTKSTKFHSNSILAQGGIAASVSKTDSWYSHYLDTMAAGCQHSGRNAVKALVETGPAYIKELMKKGMHFDQDSSGNLILGHEGAHSTRRILHVGGDATGKALVTFLFEQIKDHVNIVENHMAVDLILHRGTCIGVKALDQDEKLNDYYADHVILATGGCGGIYEYTSNDPTVVGDGYAMAFRAGADLVDMEFVQFHPTLLNCGGACPGLISEAVRGEGAILVTEAGRRIMEGVHPLQDLAPRDVVSRIIYEELQMGEKIYLDITMVKNFSHRFPTITELCRRNGVQLEKGRIAIVPGAHFMMGGIKVNENGESSIPFLYAVGEVACTGVHGANRLASNSLLEGIVFANRLADAILSKKKSRVVRPAETNLVFDQVESVSLLTSKEIKEHMMNNVGIVRSKNNLEKTIQILESFITLSTNQVGYKKEEITRLNMITTGWLISSSALRREESRGGHFRLDFSVTKPEWKRKYIVRNKHEHVLLS